MRSRAPPVADAARRSTRSGRKNRASEQREDFFGHRKAVGADAPWIPLERICAQYGFGFFAPEKSKFVASAAKRQEGLSRGKPGSPLQTPLTLSCAGYECCFSLNNRKKQIRTAHRCAPKVATAYLPPPPCGTRKELRAARLLVLFDRCGCSASLHPPLAALGFAPPFPSPVAGEGPSIQIVACSAHSLGSVAFCYWSAETE